MSAVFSQCGLGLSPLPSPGVLQVLPQELREGSSIPLVLCDPEEPRLGSCEGLQLCPSVPSCAQLCPPALGTEVTPAQLP